MRRALAPLLLILALAPGTWLREPAVQPNKVPSLDIRPLSLPSQATLAPHLGPFALEGIWQLTSPHSRFGSYSALVPLGDGELLAIGDRGDFLRFSPPGTRERPVRIGPIRQRALAVEYGYDAEAATIDRKTGQLWIGWESSNSISRHGLDFGPSQTVRPPAMRDWGRNSGPEAMTRLDDGRFILLREGFSGLFEFKRHRAMIFAGDPITAQKPREFAFDGPDGFRPTDIAQLPDGRVLILMRRLVWPLPMRFTGRIVVADPRAIRPGRVWRGAVVAKLSSTLPVDNFEGLAIESRAKDDQGDGMVTVWLISDANNAVTQRTLLWKLALDPADLPKVE